MRKYRIKIAYDGAGYAGWQLQSNALGVQQVVETALAGLDGAPVRVFGSSRTDAGVHADGLVAHFFLQRPIPAASLARAVNARLPPDVRVLSAAYAAADFDARLSAVGKEYRYRVYISGLLPPPLARYWTHSHRELDLEAMRDAARRFVGTHDFVAFAANPDREIATTVRTIFSFDVERHGPRLVFTVRGDGFLYKQVRSMVGFLLAVGRGRERPAAVDELLAAASARTARVETAPAQGLSLVRVFYTHKALHAALIAK